MLTSLVASVDALRVVSVLDSCNFAVQGSMYYSSGKRSKEQPVEIEPAVAKIRYLSAVLRMRLE